VELPTPRTTTKERTKQSKVSVAWAKAHGSRSERNLSFSAPLAKSRRRHKEAFFCYFFEEKKVDL
jgi:hypothetical protein